MLVAQSAADQLQALFWNWGAYVILTVAILVILYILSQARS